MEPALDPAPDDGVEILARLQLWAARVQGSDPSVHNPALFRTPSSAELEQIRRSMLELLVESSTVATELVEEMLPRFYGTPLEDLAATIEAEVRRDLYELKTLDQTSTGWRIGLAAAELITLLRKSAARIENAYRAQYGPERPATHIADTTTALAVRQAYAELWRALARAADTDGTDPLPRIRSASTAIALLRGRPAFEATRASDRWLIEGLQTRMRSWLESSGKSEPTSGLMADLGALGTILRGINGRAELIEHDARLLPELAAELASRGKGQLELASAPSLHAGLRRLLGRDSDLDAVIQSPSPVSIPALTQLLTDLEIALLKHLPGSDSP